MTLYELVQKVNDQLGGHSMAWDSIYSICKDMAGVLGSTEAIVPDAQGTKYVSEYDVVVLIAAQIPELADSLLANYRRLSGQSTATFDTIKALIDAFDSLTPGGAPVQSSKSVTINQNGTITSSPDAGFAGVRDTHITVAIPTPAIQNDKVESFSQNGTQTIYPSAGFDAMSRIDVIVNVPSGGGALFYPSDLTFAYQTRSEIDELTYVRTTNMTGMGDMFTGCQSVTSLDLSNFDMSNCKHFMMMFKDCRNLQSITFPSSNSLASIMCNMMFQNCTNLTSLDLSWLKSDTSVNTSQMFDNCSQLSSLIMSNEWYGSIDIKTTNLHRSALVQLFNSLSNAFNGPSITLSQSQYNELSEADKQIAATKGWGLLIN